MSRMTDEQLKQYMASYCMCGHQRDMHAHTQRVHDRDDLCVICISCSCKHFTNEVEREIGDPFKLRERLGLKDL